MATKKKAAKPVKKAAPAKKVVKAAPKKAAKPAPKKAVTPVKKSVPVKKVVKAAPKRAVKPAPKKAEAKPVKKVAPVKKVEVKKPEVKAPVKKVEVKSVAKAPVKAVAPAKPVAPVKQSMPEKAKDIKITPAKPVVLPKINTKTARKYQPDFTKSVLDQPKADPGAPMVRYSDNDLNEFRELIQRKLESAKKELLYLQGLITRKDEMGGDNDDARYMTMEDGSMSMEREQLSQMASRQITFIDHLEKALMRIENKTYGVCRVTGRLIDKARLRAVPHATLSIEAKMGAVK
ncbi:MAG: TraR/DksA family transcriptional regulator [Ferruginibacter sp.]|nr:TraR/DksA family transcriptional regulator [Ferruginibacter sp.]